MRPLKIFENTRKAIFVERKNRFLIIGCLAGREVEIHLPNPGRLRELLIPGNHVLIQEHSAREKRKTRFSLVGAFRKGTPIMLHTLKANSLVERLMEKGRLPFLPKNAEIFPEYKLGRSRFDFMVRSSSEEILVEVKSCTLFGEKNAMFPDAVSERASRHLNHLAEWSRENNGRGIVVFLVQWLKAEFFLPDFHTDLKFAKTFYELRKDIEYYPVGVEWNERLEWTGKLKILKIPWSLLEEGLKDRGFIIICCHLEKAVKSYWSEKRVEFKAGYYLFTLPCEEGAALALNRQRRLFSKKGLPDHAFEGNAKWMEGLAVRTAPERSMDFNREASLLADWNILMEGEEPVLYNGFVHNPMTNEAVQELIVDFRLNRI